MEHTLHRDSLFLIDYCCLFKRLVRFSFTWRGDDDVSIFDNGSSLAGGAPQETRADWTGCGIICHQKKKKNNFSTLCSLMTFFDSKVWNHQIITSSLQFRVSSFIHRLTSNFPAWKEKSEAISCLHKMVSIVQNISFFPVSITASRKKKNWK